MTSKLWLQWRQFPVLPLLLIVAINTAFFFLSAPLGPAVGVETGTDGYKEVAENVVNGRGFVYAPDRLSTIEYGFMKREPVYPVLLSIILRLTGALSPVVLCVFQTGLSLISCFLLYRLGEKISDSSTGRLATLIYALHPISFWYSARFASEVIAVPVLLSCLLLIVEFLGDPTRTRAAKVGLGIGIAALTKSACVTLLPLTLVFFLLRWSAKRRQLLAHASILILAYTSIHSIWLIRNYSISGELVPFTTNSGGAFFIGKGMIERFDLTPPVIGEREAERAAQVLYRSVQNEIMASAPQTSLPRLELQTDRKLLAMARQIIVEDPSLLVRKLLLGMVFVWFLSDTVAKSLGWLIFQTPLLVLALGALYRPRRLDFNQRFLLCVVVGYVLPYSLLLPLARYSTPVIPIVILFSSCGLIRLLKSRAVPAVPIGGPMSATGA